MSESERRRATDPWLERLFEQNAEQHRENRKDSKEMRELLNALAMKDENHSGRLTGLETWRKDMVDPWIEQTKDGIAQAKGGLRGMRLMVALGAAGLGGGFLPKLVAAIASALPK